MTNILIPPNTTKWVCTVCGVDTTNDRNHKCNYFPNGTYLKPEGVSVEATYTIYGYKTREPKKCIYKKNRNV